MPSTDIDDRAVRLAVRLAPEHKDLSDRLFGLVGTNDLSGKLRACHRAEAVLDLDHWKHVEEYEGREEHDEGHQHQLEVKRAQIVQVTFDPAKHPRDWHGRFRRVLEDLPKPSFFGQGAASTASVPGGHEVVRLRHGFEVRHPDHRTRQVDTAEEAATIVHGRYEAERDARELAAKQEAERAADAAKAEEKRQKRMARIDQEALGTLFIRTETLADAEKIKHDEELWGLPSHANPTSVASVRAHEEIPGQRPRLRGDPANFDPAREAAARVFKRGEVIVLFRTKVRPNTGKRVPHTAWTPGANQREREFDRSGERGKLHPDLRVEPQMTERYGLVEKAAKLKISQVQIIRNLAEYDAVFGTGAKAPN